MISLTNYDLATSGLGFKLSSEHEKPDDNVISAIKKLSTKTFYRIVTHMIMPFLVLHLDRVIGARTLLFFIKRLFLNLGYNKENNMGFACM